MAIIFEGFLEIRAPKSQGYIGKFEIVNNFFDSTVTLSNDKSPTRKIAKFIGETGKHKSIHHIFEAELFNTATKMMVKTDVNKETKYNPLQTITITVSNWQV